MEQDVTSVEDVLTPAEIDMLRGLRDRGYAVIIWHPSELGEASIEVVEDRSVALGWEIIGTLNPDGGCDDC